MFLVLIMACVIWGIGIATKAPNSMRWTMIAVLYVAVLGIQLLFPVEHPLRASTGGSYQPWLMLGGVVALVFAYRAGLKWLKSRVSKPEEPVQSATFSETELDRYARHIVLHEIGGPGQKKLKDAKVLVIGAGGLGAPVLQYLAAAGVGTIGIVDDDTVDNSNLQRQVIHQDRAIGMPKVHSAAQMLRAQNPFVKVLPYERRLTDSVASELISDFDLVLDGTDNFETRYLVNATCVRLGKPLISGALSQWEGQVSVFDAKNGTPCYQCVFDKAPAPELAPNCAQAGVVGPLAGVVGSIMAMEAIKTITGAGQALTSEMLIYDGLYGETRKIALKKNPKCPACGQAH